MGSTSSSRPILHMTELEFTFMHDTLFKAVFVAYPDLLKQLVAELLKTGIESITEL